MSDRKLAGFILAIGAIGIGYWLLRLQAQVRGGAESPVSGPPAPGTPSPGITPPAGRTGSMGGKTPLQRLMAWASSLGLIVTSTTGGKHKGKPGEPGSSLHYVGRAIDVQLPAVSRYSWADVFRSATEQGFYILPEFYKGYGRYGYSSGPHAHVSVPISGDPRR